MLSKGIPQADDSPQHLKGTVGHRGDVVDHLLVRPMMMLYRDPGLAETNP
jgi:hypothetical protein